MRRIVSPAPVGGPGSMPPLWGDWVLISSAMDLLQTQHGLAFRPKTDDEGHRIADIRALSGGVELAREIGGGVTGIRDKNLSPLAWKHLIWTVLIGPLPADLCACDIAHARLLLRLRFMYIPYRGVQGGISRMIAHLFYIRASGFETRHRSGMIARLRAHRLMIAS